MHHGCVNSFNLAPERYMLIQQYNIFVYIVAPKFQLRPYSTTRTKWQHLINYQMANVKRAVALGVHFFGSLIGPREQRIIHDHIERLVFMILNKLLGTLVLLQVTRAKNNNGINYVI